MDGNGRWAESRGLMRIEGHKAGINTVKTVIQCCIESRIPILSLFAFSSENWLRPEQEVEFLMQLFIEVLQKELQSLHENRICLQFIGDRSRLSSAICEQMARAELLTVHNNALILNLALNYSGRDDILNAVRCIINDVLDKKIPLDSINENNFSQYLTINNLPEPDLFIRTSGEWRISNFFLWQLAYTELYFTSVYWPDFKQEEFTKALISFSQRERRYGRTSQQIKE